MARTSVKVIEDSIFNGNRLITFELEYPRYIHSELMTHRVFSRNAQSSRAIPVEKLIQRVEENNWYPIWMANKPGMSPDTPIEERLLTDCKLIWDTAKSEAIVNARRMAFIGSHKQIVNRILEPFSTIKVIVSSTEWNNFFRLRLHPAAQQEMQELAQMILNAMKASTPKVANWGYIHLPYVSQDERESLTVEEKLKLSTARCARVSYLNHDGVRNLEKDYELHDSLYKERHMSPFEHSALPCVGGTGGNFEGWRQYRFYVENDLSVD